jgi:ComF family protein
MNPSAPCPFCVKRPFRFDRLVALGDYESHLRAAVLRMKRPSGEPLAAALARLLWQSRGGDLRAWNVDVVLPIPMHWLRRIARGVNSPEVIGRTLAHQLRTPISSLLRRRRWTRAQGQLPASRRVLNLKNAFRLLHANDFRGARVLLVDDVVTSGATSNEAARVLHRAGAEFVGVAAICRTQLPARFP